MITNILTKVKQKKPDGSYGESIPIGTETKYIKTSSGQSLADEILIGQNTSVNMRKDEEGNNIITESYGDDISKKSYYKKVSVIHKKNEDGIIVINETLYERIYSKETNSFSDSIRKEKIIEIDDKRIEEKITK